MKQKLLSAYPAVIWMDVYIGITSNEKVFPPVTPYCHMFSLCVSLLSIGTPVSKEMDRHSLKLSQ